LFVRSVLVKEGEDVLHQSGGGNLVIYKPLPPELKEAAPPPPKPEEKKPDQPERKTRFPTT
jgi:hypothetical protein